MADKSFQVEIVSADDRLYSGGATFVIAHTTTGELGILANHQPLLGELIPGGFVVVVEESGDRRAAAVTGGFISVTGTSVTVLAEYAEWVVDVDVTAEQEAVDAAEPGSEEYTLARSRLVAAEQLAK